MKRLIIKFPDDSYINIAAEHMDKPEGSNMVYCYHGDEIVAIFDSAGITEAHFSEKEANV